MEYIIKNEELELSVSNQGAEMQSIISTEGISYLWNGNHSNWGFRAPILFPSVSWFYQNAHKINEKIYPMPFNGFIQECRMKAILRTDTKLVFETYHNRVTMNMFPYKFVFRVSYGLERNNIKIDYTIKNVDDKIMHFSFGSHPCFNVSLVENLSFDDYYYEFPEARNVIRVLRKEPECRYYGGEEAYHLSSEKRLILDDKTLGEAPILLKNMGKKAVLGTDKDSHRIEIEYPEMNLFMIWHLTGVPAITAEPWTSYMGTDQVIEDYSKREDMIHLEAGNVYNNHMFLRFY